MSRRPRSPAHLINTIRTALRTLDLLPHGQRVLVAVSGGQDSLTLSEALSHINRTHAPTPRWSELSLAHCDHRWPGDEGIAAHVTSYAKSRRLRLHLLTASPPPRTTEAAGRSWRYESLSSLALAQGYDAVVTGHTATDLCETVVHALATGAGPDGLSSLSWTRPLADGVALVRPMLGVSRDDTEAFCDARGIAIWHDPYNDVDRYARNRVRKQIVPLLAQTLNPRVEDALARTAHLLRDDAAELERVAGAVFVDVVQVVDGDKGVNGMQPVLHVDRVKLAAQGVAIQRRVVRKALREVVGVAHDGAMFAQVEAVLALLHADVGQATCSLSRGAQAVVVDRERVEIRLSFRGDAGQDDRAPDASQGVGGCTAEATDWDGGDGARVALRGVKAAG